ncbi:hypothetical protein [Actinoplanes sp. NPDC026619]|uniref:hypothetical protein n=1 Tax=Actinoplanes sp. NPDC026619 TaxID=3155798 RepID=UPI0034002A62
MQCDICGTPLDRPGQGHFCRRGGTAPDESGGTFSLATRRVVRFGAIYAILVAVTNALAVAGVTAIRSGAATDPAAAGVLIGSAITGFVGLICIIGLLISIVVWIVSAHRLTAAGPGLIGYGGVLIWVVLSVLAYVVPPQVPSIGAAAATEASLRIAGLALLIAAVRLVRSRLRQATGRPDLAARPKLISSDDWDAGKWDPEVLRDIERRRSGNG